ncbi:MAG: hypothetical protein PT956_00385 [Firmicutes bacterium]|nr:hypothetical protein [Bacillota bacterium]
MRQKDYVPAAVVGGLSLLYIILAIIHKENIKVFLLLAGAYLFLMHIALAATKWVRHTNVIISLGIIVLFALLTWMFLKTDILSYGLIKVLFIILFLLFIANAILAVISMFLRKKRRPVHYIGIVIFLLMTAIVAYILYIYVFGLMSLISF